MKSFPITNEIRIGGNGETALYPHSLPSCMRHFPGCGIVAADGISARRIFEDEDGKGTYEVRGTVTPKGDIIIMFPLGEHYTSRSCEKPNEMVMLRSTDDGRTWSSPTVPFDISHAQHGFIPLIPKGGSRIYCFGTQPVKGEFRSEDGQGENAPIGYFTSDDDGCTWSELSLIRPTNDYGFRGMSVTRMTETDSGTWIIGSHEADWSKKPLETWQYLLRSEDKGKSWQLLPDKRHGGFQCPGFGRMDEGRPIALDGSEVYCMFRTPEGHIWQSRSTDDGKTWEKPTPTTLVHPDAPPMVFRLSDKRLVCFHHNRHHDTSYSGLSGDKSEIMADRSEIWAAFSEDGGRTWSEPRLIFANACTADYDKPFFNFQCSYIDMIEKDGRIHIFVPHLWHRILHLEADINALLTAPTINEIMREC